MRILALSPYHGGSHRDFLDGWCAHSRHAFEVAALPARHWKWRMRHAAWTLAERTADWAGFDAVFATDMLDVTGWRAHAALPLRSLPLVLYMHENQLVYPDPHRAERDHHFGFTNVFSAAAADQVWWNSAWHRDAFFEAATALLERMPDHAPTSALERARRSSRVEPPGHGIAATRRRPRSGPPHLLWAARWEHDKGPADLFAALAALIGRGVEFQVSVLGKAGALEPAEFTAARAMLGQRVQAWGYLPRVEYEQVLASVDLVVSTARHEFFGIAMVEAIAAGAFPIVPRRLAYPEVLAGFEPEGFYDGSPAALAERLTEACAEVAAGTLWGADPGRGQHAVAHLSWTARAAAMDAQIERLASPDSIRASHLDQ
jgi:glycosyltransferase involved in cell wall biosynthesis